MEVFSFHIANFNIFYPARQIRYTVHPRMTDIALAQFVYDETLGFDILQILGPTIGTKTM